MQLMKLLHKTFKKELPFIHKTRLKNLMTASETAMKTNKLYLTGLGRELSNKNKTSSNIQKMDRLLSNEILHSEQIYVYKTMNSYLIREGSTPWLHIDWSCINPVTNLYLLRASLSMQGRSIVIHEECHPKKKENNHATHKAFLDNLKKMLPTSVKPVIITDAGFRAPWFAYVRKLGWHFVGRLRNKNLILLDSMPVWQLSKTLFEQATGKPTCIGHGLLTEEGKVPAHFVLYKGPSKNRHKLNINKKPSSSGKSKRHSQANKEPWVLVTSLPLTEDVAKQTVNIYRQRMRIEENFRDTKCPHYGLGLKNSLSRSTGRMTVLLLIAAIATFASWIAGIFTTYIGKATDFQAHSAKFKSALSKVFLGREAFKKGLNLTIEQLEHVFAMLYQISLSTQLEAPV